MFGSDARLEEEVEGRGRGLWEGQRERAHGRHRRHCRTMILYPLSFHPHASHLFKLEKWRDAKTNSKLFLEQIARQERGQVIYLAYGGAQIV